MSESSKKDKTVKKSVDSRFKEVFENETQYGILMAIRNFGSMNIKKLAGLMGKTESTIHHHISEMLRDPKVIEIDTNKTEKERGKYYKLSPLASKRYPREPDTVFEDTIPTIMERAMQLDDEDLPRMILLRLMSQKDLGSMAQKARRAFSYYHNIENFILNSFEQSEQAILNRLKPRNLNYPLGSHTLLSMDMKVSKPRHMMEIGIASVEFFAKLTKLKRKFDEEMDSEGVKEEDRIDAYFYLFGGEVSEFEFEKDEKFDYDEFVKPVTKKLKKIYEGIEGQ